jgi:transcriptional regulator with GAF, ATPase, and Fis domain
MPGKRESRLRRSASYRARWRAIAPTLARRDECRTPGRAGDHDDAFAHAAEDRGPPTGVPLAKATGAVNLDLLGRPPVAGWPLYGALGMTPEGLADLVACVAAFGRSLDERFDPVHFLAEFSARSQRLVPHDHMAIVLREADGHAWSVFAEYATRGTLLGQGHYTTAFERGDRVPGDDDVLLPVFEGEAQIIADVSTDPRFAESTAGATEMIQSGLRGRLAVPLYGAGRIAGAFVVASTTAGIYTDAHVSACRQIADLIGPFVETVVWLHRERRRRERLKAATALASILGASLKVGDVLERLGAAVRPLIGFDVMGVALLSASGRGFEQVGLIGANRAMYPRTSRIEDYSVLERVGRGEPVLVRHAERELDRRRPGDRLIIAIGNRSVLGVPLLFGERVGGGLFFATPRVHWYDESDVEIAGAIAAALVVAVQHQRLAEQQQRLGAVETRAQRLEQQVATLRDALNDRFGFDAIIGLAPAFLAALEAARKVAAADTTVVLTGESGTGKEVVARAIHQASARAEGPFVALNCAALPETLVESELFGHERGAFTGADRLKRGRFEIAAGGTLFLDEIAELAPAAQAKLLRVLEERQYERVGGTTTLRADVRVVAATNRDLERAVAEGRVREDLYYRLAVFRIHLPPLRKRGEDVLLLADHFVRHFCARMGKGDVGLSREARDVLLAHSWPGNIRELENAIERALILADGEWITASQLGIASSPAPAAAAPVPVGTAEGVREGGAQTLAELEKQMILDALKRSNGNKSHAAAALGLSRTRFYTRLRRLGLR